MKNSILLLLTLIFISHSLNGVAQEYYSNNYNSLFRVNIDCSCSNCCEEQLIGATYEYGNGLSMDPLGELYGLSDDIYSIDPNSGTYSIYFDIPSSYPLRLGLISVGGGIFYSMVDPFVGNGCVEINTNNGVLTNLGSNPIYPCHGDMTLFNGEVYYPTF